MPRPAKPGNEPDPGDMSTEFDPAADARPPAASDPTPAEDEAAKLGDFA